MRSRRANSCLRAAEALDAMAVRASVELLADLELEAASVEFLLDTDVSNRR